MAGWLRLPIMAALVGVAIAGPVLADDTPPLPRPRPDIDAQPEPPPVAPGQESDRQKLIKQGFPGGEDSDALMPPTDSPAELAKFGTTPRPVSLVAEVTEKGAKINAGLVWRIFSATPDKAGNLPMVAKSDKAAPTIPLAPGNYVVHVAYGNAQTSDTLDVRGTASQKTMILDVGGLKLNAAISGDVQIPADLQKFDVFTPGTSDADRTLVASKIAPGEILALNAGTYHVVSYFGGINAVERADLQVEPGEVTEATLYQKAAQVSLKLTSQAGGEAIADVDWTIADKTGHTLFQENSAFPATVLAEGDYTVTAKRAGKAYSKTFHVSAGKPEDIEVLTNGS